MLKNYDDNLYLCSNRKDRKIPPHGISGKFYDDENGFTFFELDQTRRDFANSHVTILPGHFLVTSDKKSYKIIDLSFRGKRPYRVNIKAIQTGFSEIPFYHKSDFGENKMYQNRMRWGKTTLEGPPAL